MPRLSSGLMFGVDASHVLQWIAQVVHGPVDSRLIEIDRLQDITPHLEVVFYGDNGQEERWSGISLAAFLDQPHAMSEVRELADFMGSEQMKNFQADLLEQVTTVLRHGPL